MSQRLKRICISIFSLVLLSACVTSYDRPIQEVDMAKAMQTHIKLGLDYLRQNNLNSARFHFNKALKIDSKSSGAYAGMAVLMLREGDDARADQFYRKAISFDPGYSLARNNYGSFLYERQRYAEALAQFTAAADDLAYERRALAFVNVGLSQVKLGQQAGAESAFVRALKLDPNMSRAYIEMAQIAFAKAEYPAAAQLLSRYQYMQRPTPRSLLLQIKIARKMGDKNQEASAGLALKNLFPSSSEYKSLNQGS